MADDLAEAGEVQPVDAAWIAIMAILTVLERRFPGVTEEAHDLVVERHALAEVIRLHGRRVQPMLLAAYSEAERHMGIIAVVGAKAAKPKAKKRRG